MLEAVMFGHKGFQPVIDAIIDLLKPVLKSPIDCRLHPTVSMRSKQSIAARADDLVPRTVSNSSLNARQNCRRQKRCTEKLDR